MLDSATREQLREALSRLSGPVTLRTAPSAHADQEQLEGMVGELAGLTGLIRVERGGEPGAVPRVEVGERVAFRGVPGGHEFSSLVLAILNQDGKGKLPDEGIVRRIRQLPGPIRLRTYVSLSCENCPQVVQALNLMAILHPDLRHETVDGAVVPDEVAGLGIQGVPAVVHDGKLLHSGRAGLAELLTMLEGRFGKGVAVDESLGTYDVAVIGGGPAGASAAIYAVRKGLRVAVVAERFGGQLQETKGIENMISMPYTEGARLSAQLSEHLARYPVRLLEHRRVSGISEPRAGARRIQLESGEHLDARAVIIATGATWRRLGIPGESEHIGQGVAFCAHCDGPFYAGKRVAVVGGGNSGVEAAIDLAGIASHVTLLEFADRLRADEVLVGKLQALPNARVLTRAKSLRVIGDGAKVTGLEYQDLAAEAARVLEVDGVFVQIGLSPNSRFAQGLVELTPSGEIRVDERGRTSASGIYAAGDVTTIPFKQIVTAMGDGAKVALTAFEDRLKGAPHLLAVSG